MKSTKMDAVARDALGRVKGGALNPGGLTKEARAARDLFNKDLANPARYRKFLVAYDEQLEAGNAVILKDYADRVGGKVKESIDFNDVTPQDTTPPLSNDERRALLKAQLEAEKAK
jgi:hypothetical protein